MMNNFHYLNGSQASFIIADMTSNNFRDSKIPNLMRKLLGADDCRKSRGRTTCDAESIASCVFSGSLTIFLVTASLQSHQYEYARNQPSRQRVSAGV